MFAIIRIVIIYIISFLVSKGLLPESLADMVLNSPEALIAIELAVAAVLTLIAGWAGQKLGVPIMPIQVPTAEERKAQQLTIGRPEPDESEIAADLKALAVKKATAEIERAINRGNANRKTGGQGGPLK